MADTGAHRELVTAVRSALERGADPVRAAGQQRYMKSALPYRGLTAPQLAACLRPLLRDPRLAIESREEWLATISVLWDEASHREEWYSALAVAKHPRYRDWVDSSAMPLWERLIRAGAWWDVVDDIATHLVRPTVVAALSVEARRMREWARDDCLWVRRAAILCQVGAKAQLDRDLLTDVIEASTEDADFFSRKAIGWALRDLARSDPAWVRAFVEQHPALSGLSRREALKNVGSTA